MARVVAKPNPTAEVVKAIRELQLSNSRYAREMRKAGHVLEAREFQGRSNGMRIALKIIAEHTPRPRKAKPASW